MREVVDAAVKDVNLSTEDAGHEFFTRQSVSGLAEKQLEEMELGTGELDGAAGYGDGSFGFAECDVADGELCGLWFGLRSAQDGTDAGEEFFGLEWLGEVVVCTAFEAVDAVFGSASCGEHEDWRGVEMTDLFEYFKAIDAGEHDVEDDESEVVLASHAKTIFAAERGSDGELGLAVIAEELA